MRVVLVYPQIPQNCGNVVRSCAVTGTKLTLVRPLGFSLASRHLKRAGLDYWEGVDVEIVDEVEEVLQGEFFLFTKGGKQLFTTPGYSANATLIFGAEDRGLPKELLERYPEKTVAIPMVENGRCLNLATSVGVALYEAWRQQGFNLLT